MLKTRKQVGESDMAHAQTDEPTRQKPLRLWPGVVIVVLQWVARFVVPELSSEAALYGILGGVFGGGLATLVWWAFFSRCHRMCVCICLIVFPPQHCVSLFSVCVSLSVCVTLSVLVSLS